MPASEGSGDRIEETMTSLFLMSAYGIIAAKVARAADQQICRRVNSVCRSRLPMTRRPAVANGSRNTIRYDTIGEFNVDSKAEY